MNVAVCPGRLDILSLCTGGGGLDLGVELAMPGARTVCMVEREAFAASHLVCAMQQGLLDEAPVWSNARTFNGRPWRGIVDGLIGGIPCQPHSLAGLRQGEDDERDLWSTARRIIVQSGCWFVLIENVGGMLSSGGAERVWRDLRRLGFELEGGLFTASEVGASHERERLFILAVADSSIIGEREPHHTERPFGRCDTRQDFSGRSLRSESVDELAHTNRAGLAIGQRSTNERGTVRHERSPTPARGDGMEYTARERRGEGRAEPIVRSGRDSAGGADDAMGNAIGSRHHGGPDDAIGREVERITAEGSSGTGLFPPGPTELSRWRHTLDIAPQLEPAFRRVVDGLASRLDIARIEQLRMLGNGVLPLEGAYAFRTLTTRLAARASPGAARLVRLMEDT